MFDDRSQIDPENRYLIGGLLQVEHHALTVLPLLPGAELTRTRDAIQIDYQGEEGITILLTAEAIELRLPTVEWTQGSYGPALSSRLWRRVLWHEVEDVPHLIEAAIQARQDEFARCRYCGQQCPPEHMFDQDVCHSCASNELGVVY